MLRPLVVVEIGALAPALGSALLVDQAVKVVLLAKISPGTSLRRGAVVRIEPTWSRGTLVLSLGVPTAVLPVLWLAVSSALILLGPRVGLLETPLAWASLGLALGGAASNVLDVAARGAVLDYVHLRFWPAFNLADAAIVVGVLGAVLSG